MTINDQPHDPASPGEVVLDYDALPAEAHVDIVTTGGWPAEPATVAYASVPALVPFRPPHLKRSHPRLIRPIIHQHPHPGPSCPSPKINHQGRGPALVTVELGLGCQFPVVNSPMKEMQNTLYSRRYPFNIDRMMVVIPDVRCCSALLTEWRFNLNAGDTLWRI